MSDATTTAAVGCVAEGACGPIAEQRYLSASQLRQYTGAAYRRRAKDQPLVLRGDHAVMLLREVNEARQMHASIGAIVARVTRTHHVDDAPSPGQTAAADVTPAHPQGTPADGAAAVTIPAREPGLVDCSDCGGEMYQHERVPGTERCVDCEMRRDAVMPLAEEIREVLEGRR